MTTHQGIIEKKLNRFHIFIPTCCHLRKLCEIQRLDDIIIDSFLAFDTVMALGSVLQTMAHGGVQHSKKQQMRTGDHHDGIIRNQLLRSSKPAKRILNEPCVEVVFHRHQDDHFGQLVREH